MPDKKVKTNKKQTVEEKIAAQKATKEIEEEEPIFTGLKLRKAKPVQSEWKEDTLEMVNLKGHKFEQIPQVEMVKSSTKTIIWFYEKGYLLSFSISIPL